MSEYDDMWTTINLADFSKKPEDYTDILQCIGKKTNDGRLTPEEGRKLIDFATNKWEAARINP